MKLIEQFLAACLAIFRHLRGQRNLVMGAVGITALGCVQEEIISNQLPDTDFDGDGVSELDDCDDTNPSVGAPAAGESCPMPPTPCDDPCAPSCEFMLSCNTMPDFDGDGFTETEDCDDENPLIYPNADHSSDARAQSALEALACEGDGSVDADCDGEPDYFCVIVNPVPPDLDADEDMDGYPESDDCDDENALIYPNADHSSDQRAQSNLEELACEVGEPVDADCNGEPDYFCVIVNPAPPELDADMDGYPESNDCDDENPLINPDADDAPESDQAASLQQLACDQGEPVDANCDGEADYFCVIVNPPPPELDVDMDGYPESIDCDDNEALIHPDANYRPDSREAFELMDLACSRGEAVDANCDGNTDFECNIVINPVPDFDRDGYTDDDCEPEDALIHPNASYAPGSREAQILNERACELGTAIDVDCDNEPDYFCVIVNPEPSDEF